MGSRERSWESKKSVEFGSSGPQVGPKIGPISTSLFVTGAGRSGPMGWYTFQVMSSDVKAILEATLKLNPQERARIAHELIVSLDEGSTEAGVEAAWEQELERRAGEIDSGAVKLEPWAKLRQELDDIVRGS